MAPPHDEPHRLPETSPLLWTLTTPKSLTTRTIAVMARPLRCLLRLHRWDYRENPETGQQFQVCLRCNAYRDKGDSAYHGLGG